jgi:SAM-dependent methyltransferase
MTDILPEYERIWADRCIEESRRCSTEYWNSRADDYADFISHSDFEHGRKILSLFQTEGIFSPEWHILDIGSGPGAISIPFASEVSSVTSVEPAHEMGKKLSENALNNKLSNIAIIPHTWQEVDTGCLKKRFDLVICCHSVWHFPDLYAQIDRMQQVSRGYCAIAHGVPPPGGTDNIPWKLGIPGGEDDRFRLVKNILENRGIYPDASILPTMMRRSVESARSMLILGLKKYREPGTADIAIIEEHLEKESKDGMYEREGKMGVLWWRVS